MGGSFTGEVNVQDEYYQFREVSSNTLTGKSRKQEVKSSRGGGEEAKYLYLSHSREIYIITAVKKDEKTVQE